MLKRKREVNYRKALTRWERCKYCAKRTWTNVSKKNETSEKSATGLSLSSLTSLPARPARYEWRCKVIGLASSRRYCIQDGHVCNGFEKGSASE